MTDPKLIALLDKKLRSGYPHGELREDLVAGGMAPDAADAVLRELHDRQQQRALRRDALVPVLMSGVLGVPGLAGIVTGAAAGPWLLVGGAAFAVMALVNRRKARAGSRRP
ncbi:MAG: hypothetical protein EOO11_11865 [Chitinophagaceae bacterium]|nr:MAG: hypothetical protein EOO11_11865 [Chitinophagaceae bacterium]